MRVPVDIIKDQKSKIFSHSFPFGEWHRRMLRPLVRCGAIAFLSLLVACACSAQTNVLTYHNDNGRTGQNLSETILSPSNVNSTNFGKVGLLSVTGLVDAEPLYVANLMVGGASHNVLFLVTEHDLVYAFDADTFAQLWQSSVLGANETTSDDRGCDQVTPEIGITSTPVIDLTAGPHGTIFVVAMSKDASGNYYHRLHALDLTTGSELPNSPTTIQATFPNMGSGVTTFDPSQYKERSGLLLLNGVIYLGWASHCDYTPYTGWVMGYSESTLQQTSVLDFTPNGSDGAVWMAGAGMAADSSGNIYFLAANGTFDNTLNATGFPINGDYGNAFMKLSTAGNVLSVADYFAMYDASSESAQDEDLGSGGALLLPDLLDNSGNTHQLAVGAGKDAHIYVVNRDSMGKFNPNNDNAIYQEIINNGLSAGVWAMPAYFNNTVYYGAQTDSLKAFQISNAQLVTPPSSQSAATYAYPGTTPSVSANGTSNGIVWAVENGANNGILHAYNATNLATELYNSNQAGTRDQFADNKYVTPMITNGKVYVGTPTGVIVFGLLPGSAPPPTISNVSASSITSSGATIMWTTNVAANSQVEYGTTTSYGSLTTLDTNLVTSHSEPVSGLTAGTLYHYRVHSADGSGNISVSGDLTFTTGAPVQVNLLSVALNPPVVSGGMSSTGTVTLSFAAPAGGALVTLSGNDETVAIVDGSTTVAAGATTATFNVFTNSVNTVTPVTITGSYNGTQSTTLIVNPAGISLVSIWDNSATPLHIDSQPVITPGEYGMRFTSDSNGYILGVRFYKGPSNVGTHVGNLWSSAGQLLATATFTAETASGWQQVLFSNPVQITANTDYIASYYNPTGDFSYTDFYFALGSGADNAPLHAPPDSVGAPNGVFASGPSSSFPNNTYDSYNYWVDVIFDPTPTNLTMTTPYLADGFETGFYFQNLGASGGTQPYTWTLAPGSSMPPGLSLTPAGLISGTATGIDLYNFTVELTDSSPSPQTITQPLGIYFAPAGTCPCTIWPSDITPLYADSSATTPGEFGVHFHADSDGDVVGIRFYKGPLNTGTHVGNLWSNSGQLLATATFTGETASGWQQVNFSSPVHITANTEYVASYYSPTGDYSYTDFYFALGSGADNAPLHAPPDTQSTPDGVYAYGATSSFPSNTFNSYNYWVDLVFNAIPGPTLASVSINPSPVTGGSTTTGTVTLSGPAPTGGETVSLASTNSGVISAPATVTVLAGSSSATFTVTTYPMIYPTAASIIATGNGIQSGSVTVNPPSLASISLNPTTVVGGTSSTATVTLDGPAPIGGWLVTLSSSSPSATVPNSVTVPFGSSSATFTVTTAAVTSATQATISGTAGVMQSAILTINLASLSSLSLNPSSVGGGTPSTGTVTLNGPAPAGGISVTLSSSNTAAATVPASVSVAPNATMATFTVTTFAVGAVTQVTISGMYNGGTQQNAILTINNIMIANVASGTPASNGATITWTTNVAANSQVEYGTTTSYGSLTTLDSNLVTSHSEPVSGLTASTLYHYRVHSTDGAGNAAVSGDFTFTTASISVVTTTLTFDDISTGVLTGQYPTGLIDWGTGTTWEVSGPWNLFTTQSLSFNGASITSGSFSFVSSSHVVSVQAYNGGTTSSTITISCTGQTTVTATAAAGVISTINTNWTTPCTTVTIGSSNGWNTNFDNMVVSTP